MGKFKRVTHVLAGALAAVIGFAMSPAGMAVVKQYPKLTGLFAFLAGIGVLYHSPKNDE